MFGKITMIQTLDRLNKLNPKLVKGYISITIVSAAAGAIISSQMAGMGSNESKSFNYYFTSACIGGLIGLAWPISAPISLCALCAQVVSEKHKSRDRLRSSMFALELSLSE